MNTKTFTEFLFAAFTATIFATASYSAQMNEIDQVKATLSRAPKQIRSTIYDNSAEQKRGYFDLVFGDGGCSELSDLIDAAQKKTNFFGKYTILSSLTLKYLPRGRAEIKLPKVLIQKGTDVKNSDTDANATIEPEFCGSTIVKTLPTDQEISLSLNTTGNMAKFDIGTVLSLLSQVFDFGTDVLSVVRPELGASISAGTRKIKIGNDTKTIADWRKSLTSRADAVDRILKKVSMVLGDKNMGIRTVAVRSNIQSLAFSVGDTKERVTIEKQFRWSVLVPANEDDGVKGHKFDADGVTSETELVNSLGADADTLAKEVDTSYLDVLKQDDKAVMKLCNRFIRAFGAHLQRHDSLALTWLVVRKGALQNNTHSRCFDDDQIAELKSYGITEPPYSGAYGPASPQ